MSQCATHNAKSEPRTPQREKGFTLIELLVAITIFSIVAVALYSTMRTGIDAWRRGEEAGSLYQEARLALATMALELRNINTTFGKGIEVLFEGGPERLSFPALVNTASPGQPPQLELGKVTYYLYREERSLRRQQETYLQSLKEVKEPSEEMASPVKEPSEKVASLVKEPSEEMASLVKDLGFEYYYERVEDEEIRFEWRDSWEVGEEGPAIPRGVRIALTIEAGRNSEGITFTRTVWIPMGEPGKLEE